MYEYDIVKQLLFCSYKEVWEPLLTGMVIVLYNEYTHLFIICNVYKGTSRQRSGKGAIRKRFPLQKPRWEKTKLTIRYLYHETYRKPNEQLFSQ